MDTATATEFTPWASLGGGVLIGLSAVMVMGLFGRIAGIAGITKGAVAALVSQQSAQPVPRCCTPLHAWKGLMRTPPLCVCDADLLQVS